MRKVAKTAERRNELLLEAVIEWMKRRSLEDLVDFYEVEGDEEAVDCLQKYEEGGEADSDGN